MRSQDWIESPSTGHLSGYSFVSVRVLIFVFATTICSLAGWQRDLWAPDEPRHAEVAAEMLRGGDFVVPHLNGEVYPDKPAPPFWLIAASMRIFGFTEWAARLPFAVAAGLVLALVFGMTSRLFSTEVATTATLVLATTAQFMWLSQRVSLDVLQTLFCLLAVLAWLRESRGQGTTISNGVFFFGACGLGLSTKGPTALLVPIAAAIGHARATGTLHRLRSPRILFGVLLMLAIVSVWLVPAGWSAGSDYLREILGRKSIGRIGSEASHARPPWYYLHEFPLEFLPWSLALVSGLWLGWKRKLNDGVKSLSLLWYWIGIPMLVLTLSTGKRGNYLMPLFPAAAIVTALALHRLDMERYNDQRLRGLLLASMRVIVGLIALIGLAAMVVPFTHLMDEYAVSDLRHSAPVAGLFLILVGAGALYGSRRGLVPLSRTLAVGMLVCVPVIALTIFPVIDTEKSDRALASELLALTSQRASNGMVPKPIVFLGHAPEASRFYSDLDCREAKNRDALVEGMRSGKCDVAVIETKYWNKLPLELRDQLAHHELRAGRGRDLLILEVRR